MEPVVGVSCIRCETLLFVARTPVDPAVAAAFLPEHDFTGHLADDEARTRRLAVADAHGCYRCPTCGARGRLT